MKVPYEPFQIFQHFQYLREIIQSLKLAPLILHIFVFSMDFALSIDNFLAFAIFDFSSEASVSVSIPAKSRIGLFPVILLITSVKLSDPFFLIFNLS